MNTEFIIDINGNKTEIYMQAGFFNHNDMLFPAHKHPLTEMHILICGTAILECDGNNFSLQAGDVMCVPANAMHTYHSFEKDSKRITFFVDCDYNSESPKKIAFSKNVLTLLCEEIQKYILTGNDNKLKPLLSYMCTDFFAKETKNNLLPLTNRTIIIDDFFSQKYNSNPTLDDLAKELMLSKKQTERAVKKVTGNTFVAELAKRKIEAAIMLTQTTNLSLTKISELVGYSSYSGFYKSYKKWLNNSPQKNEDT